MPADVRFVQFIARRYAGLHGYAAVVLALTLFAAAPLLPRAWTPREWTWLAGIGAAFVAALMATDRYYGRTFGRTRQTTYDKHHTWSIALALFLLDALSRALPGQNIKTGLLALGFGGALAVEAWRDRRFRAHAFLVPAVALYIGVDRLTASGQRAIFGQSNDFFDFWAHGFGPYQGCGNPTVAEQLGGERSQKRPTLIGGLTELRNATTVAHNLVSNIKDKRSKKTRVMGLAFSF